MVSAMIPSFNIIAYANDTSTSWKVEGNYKYYITDGNATISSNISSNFSGVVSIPSTIGGYPVTEIGSFYLCEGITRVIIPSSATSISENAFQDCSSLASVSIPSSVKEIKYRAFMNCGNLQNVSFQNGVKTLGWGLFENCTSLKTITLPASLEKIYGDLFSGCSSLTSISMDSSSKNFSAQDGVLFNKDKSKIVRYPSAKIGTSYAIPSSVRNIEKNAFKYCENLTSITIPNIVTEIGINSFQDCHNLSDVTLPESLISIGEDAFEECTSLKTITLPQNVTSIGEGAFSDCRNLSKIEVNENNKSFCSYSGILLNKDKTTLIQCPSAYPNENITIPNGVTSISKYAFVSCENLKSITVPESLQSVGLDAFSHCDNIEKVNISNLSKWCSIDFGLENYVSTSSNPLYSGNGLLYLNGTLIKNLVVPSGVKQLGLCAFAGISLNSITVPDSVVSIDQSFYGCSDLESLTIPCSFDFGHNRVFDDASIDSLTLTNGTGKMAEYPNDASSSFPWSTIRNIYIQNNVCSLEMEFLKKCANLESFNVSSDNKNYSSVDGVLYNKNKELLVLYPSEKTDTEFVIPSFVKSIGDYAFNNCNAIISLESDVNSIGRNAFYQCSNLKKVEISNSCPSIGDYAFYRCNGATFDFAQGISKVGAGSFDGSNIKSITLKDGVKEIGDYAFNDCPIIKIEIPNSVETIGNNAFSYCDRIEDIAIPSSVKTIGDNAFRYCSEIRKMIIPSSVSSIGNNAFESCKNLYAIVVDAENMYYSSCADNVLYNKDKTRMIKIPENLSRTKYVLPNTVEEIDDYAIENCQYIKNIVIDKNVKSLSKVDFSGCYELNSVTILNPNCELPSANNFPSKTVLCGLSNSTTQKYAESNGYTFEAHSHSYVKKVIAPTCTSRGYTINYCECGDEFIDNYTSLAPHTEVIDKAVPATCFATGLTEGKHCSVCGAVIIKQNVTPKLSHDYKFTKTVQPTCSTKGYTLYTCTKCGDTYNTGIKDCLPHTEVVDKAVEANCIRTGLTEGKHCSVCNTVIVAQRVIPKTEHKYEKKTIKPTENSQGYDLYTCVVCNDSYKTNYTSLGIIIEGEKIKAKSGQRVKIPIKIKNNTGLLGFKLTFSYDAEKMKPETIEYGDCFDSGLQDNIEGDAKAGEFSVYWTGNNAEKFNGTVFYINMLVDKSAVGDTTIGIDYSRDDTFDDNFKSVALTCNDVSISITNASAKNYCMSEILGGTDFQLNNECSAEAGETVYVKTLLNHSNSFESIVNRVDKNSRKVKYTYDKDAFEFVGFYNETGTDRVTYEDAYTSVTDGVIIDYADLNACSGLVFKAKENAVSGKYEVGMTFDKAIENMLDQYSCNPLKLSITPSQTSDTATVSVKEGVTGSKGEEISVPVQISNNHGIMGYKIKVEYDSSQIEPVSVTKDSKFAGNFNDTIGQKNGEFYVVWNSTQGNTSNGNLMVIKFKVITSTACGSKITLSYSQTDTFNEKYDDVVFDCKSSELHLNGGHKYTTKTIAPTCTENGYTIYTCTTCNYSYRKSNSSQALGHNWNDGTVIEKATCTENGVKRVTCTRCKMNKNVSVPMVGHKWGSGIVTKSPTCTAEGTKTYTCSLCNEKRTERIAKTEHKLVSKTTKATLSANGKKETKCSVCGAVASTTTIQRPKTIKLSAYSYTYNGKTKTPSISVKDASGKTISRNNYTVKYASGRKNVGKYSVKITFKGYYTGTKTLYFTVVPKGTSISSISGVSKGFSVKWKKQRTQTTGYEIQYATNSKFTKGKKSIVVSKNSTTSKKVKKLKKKQKYYVRVRTYKTVKVNGKSTKIYSNWSKSKSIKSA